MGTKKDKLVHTILPFPVFTGAPGGSRTHDPWLRKPILYPTELRAHHKNHVDYSIRGVACPFESLNLAV